MPSVYSHTSSSYALRAAAPRLNDRFAVPFSPVVRAAPLTTNEPLPSFIGLERPPSHHSRTRLSPKTRFYGNTIARRLGIVKPNYLALMEDRRLIFSVLTRPEMLQEVCETEEKVGGMGMICSGIQDKSEKHLSIVGVRSGAPEGIQHPQTLPAPPGTMDGCEGTISGAQSPCQ